MESEMRLLSKKDAVDIRIWPIFHFLSDKEIEDINLAVVIGRGCSALYVTKNDEVFGIGSNKYNVLGNNLWKDSMRPLKVEQLCGKKIKDISFGTQHVMALTKDGIVYNWGDNDLYQLGTKNPNDIIVPSVVGSLFSKKVVQIACSTYYSLVLCDNSEVYEWGNRNNSHTRENAEVETLVEGALKNKEIISVACSEDASFALSSDGVVYSWGEENANGILARQCDQNNSEGENDPAQIQGLTGVFIKKIVTGSEHVLALSSAGILYSWGKNDVGQLGFGEIEDDAFNSHPEEIEFLSSEGEVSTRKIIDMAASSFSNTSAAMDENCDVFMWGQCNEQNIGSPLLTKFKSFHEVFVFFSDHPGTFRPVTSKSSKKTLIYEQIKNSFDNKTTSDLIISVEGKEINVHKSVLRIRSNYFRNMLRDGWKENEEEVLEIKESTYVAYKALLEYFYTDNLNVPFNAAFELLDLARVHCEEELQEMCELVIKNNISVDNAASSYLSSKHMRVESLKVFCLEFMMNNFSSVVVSDDFSQLDKNTVIEIMRLASRRVKQLFKAGYKNLHDLANADPLTLVAQVHHLPRKIAREIVTASKLLILKKVETLREQTDIIKAELIHVDPLIDITFSEIASLPTDRSIHLLIEIHEFYFDN